MNFHLRRQGSSLTLLPGLNVWIIPWLSLNIRQQGAYSISCVNTFIIIKYVSNDNIAKTVKEKGVYISICYYNKKRRIKVEYQVWLL